MVRVGLVSDTHGYLHPGVHQVLSGVARILHAGDVCDADILTELATIAPVTAVRGNMDTGELALQLPERASVVVEGVRFLVGHMRERLLARGVPEGVSVVVTGHTHVAHVEERDGVLYVNPGAVLATRGAAAASVAIVTIDALARAEAEIIEL